MTCFSCLAVFISFSVPKEGFYLRISPSQETLSISDEVTGTEHCRGFGIQLTGVYCSLK